MTRSVFEMSEEFVAAVAGQARNKRKIDLTENESSDSSESSERTSKCLCPSPSSTMIVSPDNIAMGTELIREARKLTEARNEQLRLVVMSHLVHKQLDELEKTGVVVET
ncbi:hypothetical protein BGZ65_011455, partial [Modicella reniformis]